MKVMVYGSMNIDHVYQLDHLVRGGETIPALRYDKKAGGKGLNQAIALAKAGQQTLFAGAIGQDGLFLKELLETYGVDTQAVSVLDVPTGHAMIQVDQATAQNCIILFGGANQQHTAEQMDANLAMLDAGDMILMQNEINLGPELIRKAAERGVQVALNPSPFSPAMHEWPLDKVSWLILNEIEGEDLTGETDPERMLDVMLSRYPACRVVLTLGEKGSIYADQQERIHQPAIRAKAVDTTAAGDTFSGYFLSGVNAGLAVKDVLLQAAHASSIAVSRPGAAESIPLPDEVKKHMEL